MVTPPSPALESMLLVKDRRKWASKHPQLSTLPQTRGGDLLWTEKITVYPGASGPWALRESTVIYTISLLRGICFVPRVCVCVCLHTHRHRACTATIKAAIKHPCTWALRWRLSFLWNRFPGVGLLGQRAYVFLILMDFSRLISKKAVIIYVSTSNDFF